MEHSAEMPFLDHLEELRWRIIWSLAALVVGVVARLCVIVLNFDVLTWLQAPVLPFLHGHKLVVTHPGEGFGIMLQTAVVIGTVIALPMIIYQVWLFLSPALHRHEKKNRRAGHRRLGLPVRVSVPRSPGSSCCR